MTKLILKQDYRTQDGKFFVKGDDMSHLNGEQLTFLKKSKLTEEVEIKEDKQSGENLNAGGQE